MKFQNSILLLSIIAISFTSCFKIDAKDLDMLNKSEFGRNLRTTFLETAKNGNVEQIITFLDQLLAQLKGDQENDDSEWARLKKELEDLINSLNLTISEKEALVEKLEGEKLANEDLLRQALTNIVQYNDHITANVAQVAALEERRNKDKHENETSAAEHAAVVDAINEVVAELRKLEGSISGENRPEQIEALESETRDRNWSATQASFLQMATKLDQEALASLIEKLESIRDSVEASRAADNEHERQSAADFEALTGSLLQENNDIRSNLVEQEKNRDAYDAKIKFLTGEINRLNAELEAHRIELKNTQERRLVEEKNYNRTREERAEENGTVNKLKTVVEERLNKMSKYLRSNVDQA
jgi:hypothetical protein